MRYDSFPTEEERESKNHLLPQRIVLIISDHGTVYQIDKRYPKLYIRQIRRIDLENYEKRPIITERL